MLFPQYIKGHSFADTRIWIRMINLM